MNELDFNGRVFVPSNLKNNKKTIIGKFDFRDLLFLGTGGAIFSLIFFSTNKIFTNQVSFLLALVFSVPILLSGFIKIDGLRIEEYIIVWRANKMLSSKVRINDSDNIYEILERDLNEKKKHKDKKNIKQIKREKRFKRNKKDNKTILFFLGKQKNDKNKK